MIVVWQVEVVADILVLEQLAVASGGVLPVVVAVLYYLGKFPDVFSLTTTFFHLHAGSFFSLVCSLHGRPIDLRWGVNKMEWKHSTLY